MKVYNSIPHLAGSNRGTDAMADEWVSALGTGTRTQKKCRIYVSEKVDGSCTGVFRRGDELFPLTRSGGLCAQAKPLQLRLFSEWVRLNSDRFLRVLRDGERIVGEWLLQAHGTRYAFKHEPYLVHDIFDAASNRQLPYKALEERILPGGFLMPRLLYSGDIGIPVAKADHLLGVHGFLGAIDEAEGMVWRMERDKLPSLMVKYVRPSFIAGRYMFALDRPTRPDPYWNVPINSIYSGLW
jgi:hypothetical protein